MFLCKNLKRHFKQVASKTLSSVLGRGTPSHTLPPRMGRGTSSHTIPSAGERYSLPHSTPFVAFEFVYFSNVSVLGRTCPTCGLLRPTISSVGSQCVMWLRCAKMAKRIEVPFEGQTLEHPKHTPHCMREGPDLFTVIEMEVEKMFAYCKL